MTEHKVHNWMANGNAPTFRNKCKLYGTIFFENVFSSEILAKK